MNPFAWNAEELVAAATIVLAVIAFIQIRMYVLTLSATKTIERAYLDMSHKPPGLTDVGPNQSPKINVGIKNHGKTPADVIGIALEIRICDKLPKYFPDDIRPKKREWFFLNPGETMHWTPDDPFTTISEDVYNAIIKRDVGLWVIGYVDYRDRFHRRFRNRYARRLDPDRLHKRTGNALADLLAKKANHLVIETAKGYNIDYEITENGEPKHPDEYL